MCTHTHPHAKTYKSQKGLFSLYCACEKGHYEIVEMLLKAGASVDMHTKVNLFITSVAPTMFLILLLQPVHPKPITRALVTIVAY